MQTMWNQIVQVVTIMTEKTQEYSGYYTYRNTYFIIKEPWVLSTFFFSVFDYPCKKTQILP